jgi:hypothetical protein
MRCNITIDENLRKIVEENLPHGKTFSGWIADCAIQLSASSTAQDVPKEYQIDLGGNFKLQDIKAVCERFNELMSDRRRIWPEPFKKKIDSFIEENVVEPMGIFSAGEERKRLATNKLNEIISRMTSMMIDELENLGCFDDDARDK